MEENQENKNLENEENMENQEGQDTSESTESSESTEATAASEPVAATPEPAPSASEDDDEEEEIVTVGGTARKWGIYLALISIVYFIIIQFAGLAGNNAANWVGAISTIVIIVMAHREFKNEGTGFMSYKQGLGIGTLISVWSAVISSVFTWIYIKFVDDSMLTIIRDQQIEQMEERGMSEAQIEQGLEMSSAFMGPTAILIFGILGGVFIGFILSLIISAITRNDDPSAEV